MRRGMRTLTWIMAILLAAAILPGHQVLADDEPESDAPTVELSDDEVEDADGDADEVELIEESDADVPDDADDADDVDDADDDLDDDDEDDIDDDGDDADVDSDIDQPIPNQAIVRIRTGIDPSTVAARHDASVLRVIPAPNIALLALQDQRGDDEEVAALAADADVTWIELNYSSRAPEGLPRYFFTSAASEPRLVDAPALPQGLDFDPGQACVTGDGVVVAVLDTGVDANHPALAKSILSTGVNMRANSWDVRDIGNGIDDDGDGRIDEMTGHGTHVTGAILQIAPDAIILPVTVLDSDGVGDAFTVTAGIFYAVEEGAQVINLSLGSTYDSTAIATAVDLAADRGVTLVAAAGNADRLTPPEYPAADPGAISVAAVDAKGHKAAFSNYHPSVDISAPGIDLASTYPGGRYSTASGTSMAAPLVSGTVALLLDRQPDRTPASITTILQDTSAPLDLADPALEGKLGSGQLDIDAAIACGT